MGAAEHRQTTEGRRIVTDQTDKQTQSEKGTEDGNGEGYDRES